MRYHPTHPPLTCTPAVTLPPEVIVCLCGRHHMVRGQRVNTAHCERMEASLWTI